MNKSMHEKSRRTHQLPLRHVIIADICTTSMHTISPSQLIAQKVMYPVIGSTQKAIATYLIGQLHGIDRSMEVHKCCTWPMKMTGSYSFSRPMGGNRCDIQQRYAPEKMPKTWKAITDFCIAKNSSLSKVTLAVHKLQGFAADFLCQQDVTNQYRLSTLSLTLRCRY